MSLRTLTKQSQFSLPLSPNKATAGWAALLPNEPNRPVNLPGDLGKLNTLNELRRTIMEMAGSNNNFEFQGDSDAIVPKAGASAPSLRLW